MMTLPLSSERDLYQRVLLYDFYLRDFPHSPVLPRTPVLLERLPLNCRMATSSQCQQRRDELDRRGEQFREWGDEEKRN